MKNSIFLLSSDYQKREYIKQELKKIYNDIFFVEAECMQSAKENINPLSSFLYEADLLILDWSFPDRIVKRYDYPYILDYIAAMMDNNDNEPIYGNGLNFLKYLKEKGIDIKTIILSSDNLKIGDDFKNVFMIVSEDNFSAQTIKDKINADKFNKVLIKKNVNEKYKRKRSSEPWWKGR